MMDLDSAIQHCKEQVQEQAKRGCYSCAEEHQQLAEWLKELKAYKEQSGDAISRQAVLDLAEWFDLNRQHFIVANLIDEVENMPSVSPQQRTGRWIEVLDKIRAEIMDFEEELFHRPNTDYSDYAAVRHCVEIIDKYKAESEG